MLAINMAFSFTYSLHIQWHLLPLSTPQQNTSGLI